MTNIIKEELMASFRDLAVDNVMAITFQDDCAVCRQKIKDRLLFENAVEQLVRAWCPIVYRYGLLIGHKKILQGDTIVVRIGSIDAGVTPIAPNQPH
jgi:hypothetical protein